jgi:long-subunit fatty acid transport protein
MKLKSYDDFKYHDAADVLKDNTEIQSIYRSVGNLRVGGEFKPIDALSLRLGYESYGNPYDSNAHNLSQPNKDYKYNIYNCGIGYRIDNVSFDVAYSVGRRTEFSYQNLDALTTELVKNHTDKSEILFTLAIKL